MTKHTAVIRAQIEFCTTSLCQPQFFRCCSLQSNNKGENAKIVCVKVHTTHLMRWQIYSERQILARMEKETIELMLIFLRRDCVFSLVQHAPNAGGYSCNCFPILRIFCVVQWWRGSSPSDSKFIIAVSGVRLPPFPIGQVSIHAFGYLDENFMHNSFFSFCVA